MLSNSPIMEDYKTTQEFKPKGVVDICFLLDVTGSMQPCIDAVKNGIRTFISTLTSPESNGGIRIENWRACICGYRDITYEPRFNKEWLIINDFTDDVSLLHAQLDALHAQGGGEEPESLLDALYHVVNRGKTEKGEPMDAKKWRYTSEAARCIIVLTDATYHEKMGEHEDGATVNDLIPILQQERIRLSLFAPELPCHYALSCLDKCTYEAIEVPTTDTTSSTNTKAIQKAVADYVSNPENFNKTLELLAKSISQSGAADVEEL